MVPGRGRRKDHHAGTTRDVVPRPGGRARYGLAVPVPVPVPESLDVGDYFADVEEWVRRTDARVHLGKWCEDLDADDLRRMHPDCFDRFQAGRRQLDPEG